MVRQLITGDMETFERTGQRPYVISLAGFDPSAGAGVLADVKCFEQHHVYGFAICTAITVQNDMDFLSCEWRSAAGIIRELEPLVRKFNLVAAKVGLIRDEEVLLEVICYLKSCMPEIRIVFDPVLKASAGFSFHNWNDGLSRLRPVLTQLELICPNFEEMTVMGHRDTKAQDTARNWAQYCPVLLKGGHHPLYPGTDYLYLSGGQTSNVIVLRPEPGGIYEKHGSGCVLSAAVTANLALGHGLPTACRLAKSYTAAFLKSNETLLGYHSSDQKTQQIPCK